jgi:ADP-ribose pyrophosphatase
VRGDGARPGDGTAFMEIIGRSVPYATAWFDVVAKQIHAHEPPYYSLRMADYVSTVATTAAGELLVVRQFRPAVERVTLELPGGLVDPGEDAATAAARELLEETGFVAERMDLLGVLAPDTGRLGNSMSCFFAHNVVRRHDAKGEAGLTWELVPIASVRTLLLTGQFDHALNLAALLLATLKFPSSFSL